MPSASVFTLHVRISLPGMCLLRSLGSGVKNLTWHHYLGNYNNLMWLHNRSFLYTGKPSERRRLKQNVMVAEFVAIFTSFKTRSLVSTLFFMTHVEIINDENPPRLVNFLFIINNWLYNQGLTVSSQEKNDQNRVLRMKTIESSHRHRDTAIEKNNKLL